MTRRNGFTFAELLVAMVLLGLIAGMAVPRYRLYKERAYVATMRTDLGNLRIAQEAYWAENLRYSTDTTALEFRKTSDVNIALSSLDLVSGYRAIATHASYAGMQCSTATGKDAGSQESGAIVCGAATAGASTIAAGAP
ncbi:MAG TPA: prepilin-type N-terminal cleavage/methylation domain-containing protein [Gemmatimonadaceae bacterium]|nr:prepilin-type N-terminal cleavage/methylation domain-containing protein [Gemmatimonadaceae bacterium]